jgi:hypothetical protein
LARLRKNLYGSRFPTLVLDSEIDLVHAGTPPMRETPRPGGTVGALL